MCKIQNCGAVYAKIQISSSKMIYYESEIQIIIIIKYNQLQVSGNPSREPCLKMSYCHKT